MSASTSENQMKIFVKNNDVNRALRILKKKMLAEGIMKEVREGEYFRSKGEKKRLQLEQKFVREERNQIRNNRKKKNVQRSNQNSNQSRNSTRPPRNQNQR